MVNSITNAKQAKEEYPTAKVNLLVYDIESTKNKDNDIHQLNYLIHWTSYAESIFLALKDKLKNPVKFDKLQGG